MKEYLLSMHRESEHDFRMRTFAAENDEVATERAREILEKAIHVRLSRLESIAHGLNLKSTKTRKEDGNR